jgi:alkaline phosphatase D
VQDADSAHKAGPLPVLCEVFADEALRQRLGQWTAMTDAQRGMSVHVEAKGLQPARHYGYRFTCGCATSPVGRTRTTPAAQDKVASLRMVLASCQYFEQGYFTAHREIAQQDLDLVLFVGDYIDESSNPAPWCARTKVACRKRSRSTAPAMPNTKAMPTCAPRPRRTPGS